MSSEHRRDLSFGAGKLEGLEDVASEGIFLSYASQVLL